MKDNHMTRSGTMKIQAFHKPNLKAGISDMGHSIDRFLRRNAYNSSAIDRTDEPHPPCQNQLENLNDQSHRLCSAQGPPKIFGKCLTQTQSIDRSKMNKKIALVILAVALVTTTIWYAATSTQNTPQGEPQETTSRQSTTQTEPQVTTTSKQTTTQAEPEYGVEVAFPSLSFNQPVGIHHAGDGTDRLFVIEQRGVIHVFENSRDVDTASVFLDISDRVNSRGNEEGLLGLAFHPDFSSNNHFYLYYSASNPRRSVIARYAATRGSPNQADRESEQILLEIPQPYSNHNGGQLAFGPDGYLYVAVGDGGAAGDPQGNAQDLSGLLGSILRIDVNAASEGLHYGIPRDNPFVNNAQGNREEIYAYGLRNPWRFSFDPVTGWLWAGDVGQNRLEEIDIIEAGKNYGWNIMEGDLCYSPPENCNRTGLEPPVWVYERDQGISVTGGFVYRGSELASLVGQYIYGDFGSGRIWALSYDGVNDPDNKELMDTDLNIASFGVDEKNELYIAAFDGKIYILSTVEAPQA